MLKLSISFLLAALAAAQRVPVDEKNLRNVVSRWPTNAEEYAPVSEWDVSRVTDFSNLFAGKVGINPNIGGWDVSNAVNMRFMFDTCEDFNRDISGWDVSKVTDMSGMFLKDTAFNADISRWDVSNVKFMYGMFGNAKAFNQDLSKWNVGECTDMFNMFAEANNFQSDLSSWDVSKVTDMEGMFYRCSVFNSDLSGWDTSSVTNLDSVFFAAQSFNGDVTHWDTSKVTNFREAFKRAAAFNDDLCWDLSGVDKSDYSGLVDVFTTRACFNPECITAYDVGISDSDVDNFLEFSGSDPDCVGSADSEPRLACPPGAINLGNGICICFSGSSLVELEGGNSITMDKLQLGDSVLTDDGSYSEVYSFGHRNSEVKTEYVQIHSGSVSTPLEVSRNHLVFVDANKSVPAGQLTKGDSLLMANGEQAVIDEIKTVTSTGAYAPFTMSGKIVVNGVVASSYVAMDNSKPVFELAGVPLFSHHFGAHVSTSPIRLYCMLASCKTESYTAEGLSHWTATPYVAGTWLMSQKSGFVQTVLFAPAFGLALIAAGIEAFVTNSVLVAALVGAVLYYHRSAAAKSSA